MLKWSKLYTNQVVRSIKVRSQVICLSSYFYTLLLKLSTFFHFSTSFFIPIFFNVFNHTLNLGQPYII